MKYLYLCLFLSCVQLVSAQSYDAMMGRAAEALNKKDYCEAFDFFKVILADSLKATPYDYYSGAISAANCGEGEEKQAFLWLSLGLGKGLGLAHGDIDFIEKDGSLIHLHKRSEWKVFISEMKKSFSDNELNKRKKAEEWLITLNSNRTNVGLKDKFNKANSGFALYFTQVDSLKIPYIVSVPTTYNESEPMKTIVFLHGGVVSIDDFQYKSPELTKEPIFSVAETLNAIVIYPFGKKDFGWVNQLKAFENIYTVVDSVQRIYNLDRQKIYLGGMSNGGTAAFWFASQKNDRFSDYFAVSALPELKVGHVDFYNFSKGKPFFSINAKDDKVFPYDSVRALYKQYESIATDWNFKTINSGGHGFIYEPEKGVDTLEAFLRDLLTK